MKVVLFILGLIISFSTQAFVTKECKNYQGSVVPNTVNQLRSIMNNRNANRPQVYVTGVITEIGKEDHSGLPHQRFTIEVTKDIKLLIVSNLDFGRMPLAIGKFISVCGEYKRVGAGMVHWTHFDPHGSHPDGFSIIDDVLYGHTENSFN